jgi:hypothetical protein
MRGLVPSTSAPGAQSGAVHVRRPVHGLVPCTFDATCTVWSRARSTPHVAAGVHSGPGMAASVQSVPVGPPHHRTARRRPAASHAPLAFGAGPRSAAAQHCATTRPGPAHQNAPPARLHRPGRTGSPSRAGHSPACDESHSTAITASSALATPAPAGPRSPWPSTIPRHPREESPPAPRPGRGPTGPRTPVSGPRGLGLPTAA